ncbi:MAG: hypothetical protein ACR2PV_01825 [Gammaproteobacteria bacterium]
MKIKILCEDQMHEVFVRRALLNLGFHRRDFLASAVASKTESGAGEKYVRERYPQELRMLREKKHQKLALIVVIDGDNVGVDRRFNQLQKSCQDCNIPPRQESEKVAFFVPTWNIETWLAYLGGQDVDETKRDYPRSSMPSHCQQKAQNLADMCRQKQLRQPAPASLQSACDEYQRLSQ